MVFLHLDCLMLVADHCAQPAAHAALERVRMGLVFCVHGDEENCVNLAKKIEEETKFTAYAPSNNDDFII